MSSDRITKYYDYTLPFYKYFYHGKSNAIHYGFWGEGIKNHQEALLNVNKALADKVKIKKDDIVLDAGCGVGGSAIWLAQNYKVRVDGITISERQLKKARNLSVMNEVSGITSFLNRDFIKTGFEDSSYSVVWAIESVCHAEKKEDFINEAYRLLKKGGRLIVDDGFLLRSPENENEQKDLNAFLEGMALSNLAFESDFKKLLEETGFKNIKIYDMVDEIMPSSRKIYKMSLFSYPLSLVFEKLKLIPPLLTKNNLAGITQYRIIKKGIMGHRVFYAEK